MVRLCCKMPTYRNIDNCKHTEIRRANTGALTDYGTHKRVYV